MNYKDPLPKAAIQGVNLLQKTPYQVNTFVLDVMDAIWKQGGNVSGMPPFDKLPIPPIPIDFDRCEQAKIEWKI